MPKLFEEILGYPNNGELDSPLFFLYNCVVNLYKSIMTVTKNEFGQMNMFAKEPAMYMTKEAMERYGIEPYAEKAEKLNGRTAMLGFAAAVISYATTGSIFFFGIFGI